MRDEVERFIIQGQARGWEPSTVLNYRYVLAMVAEFLGKRGCLRFADVTKDDLDAFMAFMLDDQHAKGSRVRAASLLRRFFVWLHEEGRIAVNPARALPVPDDGEEDLPDPPLPEEEVAAIIDGLPRSSVYDLRNACLFELLYGCGLRISEAMALDLSDLDFRRRTTLVRDSKHGQTRVVPLPRTAKESAQTYLALRKTLLCGPDHGALFITQQGQRWKRASVYGLFKILNWQRGPASRWLYPHIFRHSIAVHLLRRGADIRYIQAFLGHASLDTTKIYLRLVPGHLKEDYDEAMPDIAVG